MSSKSKNSKGQRSNTQYLNIFSKAYSVDIPNLNEIHLIVLDLLKEEITFKIQGSNPINNTSYKGIPLKVKYE